MTHQNSIREWLTSLPPTVHREASARLMRLAHRLRERRVQFLFGAGMSVGSGLPVASRLATRLLAELISGGPGTRATPPIDSKIAAAYPLEAIAQTYADTTDPSSLTDIVNKTFRETPTTLHDGHKAVQFLVEQRLLEKLYTTNFDLLLESAFSTRGTMITDRNIDDLHLLPQSGGIPVLHLHGAVGAEPRILESETFELHTPLATMLTADMALYWFVWIGYSLTDVDLRQLFFASRKLLSQYGAVKRPYVVYPLTIGDPEVEWRVADVLWRARGCTYIPGSAELLLPALVLAIIQEEGQELAEKIVAARGGDPSNQDQLQAVWDDADKYATSRLGSELEAIRVLAEQHGVTK